MSTGLQVKLLRVLQEREVVAVGGSVPIPVQARVIAASNRDPDALMSSENFRHDLLYRLNVINIHLPPLRERRRAAQSLQDATAEGDAQRKPSTSEPVEAVGVDH